MTTSTKILVTSAAGRVGSATVQMLLEKGLQVRAFVRRKDARSQRLNDLGADIFVGNLFDFRDLEKALKGVQRVFHCPPFIENQLHATMLLCLAVEQANIETLVLLSGWNPSASHPSSLSREHWIANNIARWMPNVGLVHVNPGIFAFTYLLSLPVTAKLGLLPLPFGDGLNAPVSEHDIARVVATIVTDPKPHIGKSYRPTGPKLLSPVDVANVIGQIVGRKVRYQNIPFSMLARAAKVQGFSTFDTANLIFYAEEIREGAFAIGAPTNHVELVTGTPAESLETTVRRYYETPELIAPDLKLVSTFGALRFMARLLTTRAPNLDVFRKKRRLPDISSPLLAHENQYWSADAKAARLHLL